MNPLTKVIGVIGPGEPRWRREDPPESPSERAAHAALMCVADFYVALHACKTTEDALRLQALIAEVGESVELVNRAALQRADLLCGKKD